MREITAIVLGMMITIATVSTISFEATGAHPTGIVINEILYDPEGTEVDCEWVELWNSGNLSANIHNWSLSDQDGEVDFVFQNIAIPPNAFILIYTGSGTNSTGFVDNKAIFYMGKTSAIWSPTGDDVLLTNETGATVDFMSYGDPTVADPPPADIFYTPRNVTAEEGFSLALSNGLFSPSVPTPLEDNRRNEYRDLLLTEVHYYPDGENEFVRIHNTLQESIDISFWYITDGEGHAAFPSGTIIVPNQSYYVVQNSTLFFEDTLKIPDFEYVPRNANVKDMLVIKTTPQLANGGDEVFLKNNWGLIIDVFAYGTSAYGGEGWNSGPVDTVSQGRASKRNYNGNYSDTNTSEDWQNIRPFGIAQSEFDVETFEVNGATIFTSPDSSFEIVTSEIDKAQDFILINLYEFTNTLLCDRLIAATQRGIKVKLFLEGSPVGGINATELFIARQIVENGGEVRIMTNDESVGAHQRYLYDHAKYMVADNMTLIVMSENWGSTGVPVTGQGGNRGWGACIKDTPLATHFAELFYTDWNPAMKDSVSFGPAHPKWNDGQSYMSLGENCTNYFSACVVNSVVTVTPVIVPDTALSNKTVLGMLANAQEKILVEQFYAYKHWGGKDTGSTETTPDIYLEAVIDAARRGCQVRILLDASYYNNESDDPVDNGDTVEYVNGIAEAENLDMQAKLVNMAEHDFYKIHNKGVIADDKVLVSSINWNLESVTQNRETGIIIKNQEIADYFVTVFEHDWCDDLTSPTPQFTLNDSYMVNETVTFNASESQDNIGITNFTWVLDGNNVSTAVVWSCNFSEPGNHTAELVLNDAWGNSATLARNFLIISPDINSGTSDTDGETNNSTTGGQGSDTFMLTIIGILLLVPIVIFAVIIILAKYREK